jgi:HPt (histidine-containing phosphotransfer) domain-containing protein
MPGSSHPIDQLITLVGLANTRELVGTYLEETQALLETIGREKPARQMTLLHSLKGTSFQLGLNLFSAQCGALETRLEESPGALTAAEISALAGGFAESTPRLRRWLSNNAAKS